MKEMEKMHWFTDKSKDERVDGLVKWLELKLSICLENTSTFFQAVTCPKQTCRQKLLERSTELTNYYDIISPNELVSTTSSKAIGRKKS